MPGTDQELRQVGAAQKVAPTRGRSLTSRVFAGTIVAMSTGGEQTGNDAVDAENRPEVAVADNARRYQPKRRLGAVVAAVAVAVITVGGLTFVWLAWLLSGAAAPWTSGWLSWLGQVPASGWTTSAGVSALLVAVLAISVLTRRQSVAEHAVDVNVDARDIAREQLRVSALTQGTAEQYARLVAERTTLDRGRLDLDTELLSLRKTLHRAERESALRDRFTAAASLLSSAEVSARLAGAYALATLADDWQAFGADDERQACVSLLCAQLRLRPASARDFELHNTIVALIRQHRRLPSTDKKAQGDAAAAGASWGDCTLDLTAAYIPGVNLIDTDLRGVVLYRANLVEATLANSDLSGATAVEVDFTRANLVGVDLSGADLRRTQMTRCWLTGADMSKANLTEARLGSANMTKVNLAGAIVSGTDMATADLAEAKIDDVVHDGVTAWPYAQVSPV